MAFRGWPVEAIEFYEGLEADNSKTYWQANKTVYLEAVRTPMDALLGELAAEFGEGRIFRPNRDVRFSSDKSPYKTAIGAMVSDGGYVQLSAKGLAAGSGMWVMAPDQLERYRRSVDGDDTGQELERIIGQATGLGIHVTGHEVLKSVPRGYPKDHPRLDLLRNKGLTAWTEWPAGAWLGKPSARARVIKFFRLARPMNEWLAVHVGPSNQPAGRPG